MYKYLYISILIQFISSCDSGNKETSDESFQAIEFVTNYGSFVIRLYDETPLHRDNYLKLAEDNFYDSILFHRVIENFVIQAGDPDSRRAMDSDTLGEADLPYKIPAEFDPELFHRRGAVGAARDGNPERASSSTQFYVVHGRIYTDSTLEVAEGRINGWLAMNLVVNDPGNQEIIAERDALQAKGEGADTVKLNILNERIDSLRDLKLEEMEKYVIPDAHREHYKTIGGVAHLDQNYTVFGEVVRGMEVVDTIAAVSTNELNRPLEDVRILSVDIIDLEE